MNQRNLCITCVEKCIHFYSIKCNDPIINLFLSCFNAMAKFGQCVLEPNCKHLNQEVRPEHQCPDCRKIVHVLCGKYDEITDKYNCGCKNC